MFKDIDASLAVLAKWSVDYPILGFLAMGGLGGFVAVILMYQKAGMEFTWPTFIARCVAKAVIGLFLAVGVFFVWRASGFTSDWGYVIAGICGLGGSDIVEALILIFIAQLRQRAGVVIPKADKPVDTK